jgi:hypothetical protein
MVVYVLSIFLFAAVYSRARLVANSVPRSSAVMAHKILE